MKKYNHNYSSSKQTPYVTNIHNIPGQESIHIHMLKDDLHFSFSVEFKSSNSSKELYAIQSEDNKLNNLLSFKDNLYFDYHFDQMLSKALYNLIIAQKTYIEIVVQKDKEQNVIGIEFAPFDAIKIFTVNKYSWFITKNHEKKYVLFKIPTCHYIELDIESLGINKNYFLHLFHKLRNMDDNRSTEFILDDSFNRKYDFNMWVKKQNYLLLSYPREIGWYGRASSNPLLSESYLLFRTIKYKLFRKKCL